MATATANTYNTYLSGDKFTQSWGGYACSQLWVSRSSTTTTTTFEVWGYAYFKWIDGWSGCTLSISGTGQTSDSWTGNFYGYGDSEGRSTTKTFHKTWSYSRGTSDSNKTFSVSFAIGGYTSTISMVCTVPKLEYTACTAPTNIVIGQSIVAPAGTVSVSWSGATAGTSNPIKGYNVYRASTASGTYTKINTDVITTTSYSVTASSTRGSSYFYKIQTVGTVSGYDSGQSSNYISLKANSLPAIPTVNASTSIIPSTGGQVIFTATAGTDPDGQPTSIYYSTSSGGIKTLFTSPKVINLTSNSTYYFWTFDGLEYSDSSVTKTITKNTKPTLSITSNNTTYTANSVSTYVKNMSTTFTGNKATGTVKCDLYYSNSASEVPSVLMPIFSNQPVTNSVYMRNININELLKNIYNNQQINFYITAIFNDGVEDSATVRYPSTGYYSISSSPGLGATYNQFSSSNITGTTAGHFYNKIRKYYNYDSDISSCTVIAKYNATGQILSGVSGTLNNTSTTHYVDITFPNNIFGNALIDITINFSNGSFNKAVTFQATQVKDMTFSNVSQSGGTELKVYTSTGTFNLSSTWPFGTATSIDNAKSIYEFTVDPIVQVKFGDNILNLTYTSVSKSSDNLLFTLNKTTISTTILTNFSSLFGSSAKKNGIKNCSYRIAWTNLYGKTYISPNTPINISFEENPTLTAVESQYATSSSGSWTNLSSSSYLQETLYVRPRVTLNWYTDETITGRFMYSTDGGTTYNIWSVINYAAAGSSSRTQTSATITGDAKELPEITDTIDWKFKAVVTKNGQEIESSPKTYHAIKHTTANIVINSLSYDQDNHIVTANLNISSLGYNSTFPTGSGGTGTAPKVASTSAYLDDNNHTHLNAISSNLTEGINNYTVNYNLGSIESKQVCIEYTSTIKGFVSTTKTTYSLISILYNIMPTLAYRKNKIGINTNNLSNDSVIDVASATGKTKIIVHFTDGTTGIINLSTKTIDNFIIDGGTW